MADAVVALHAGNPMVSRDQAVALRRVAEGNALAARQAGLDGGAVDGWLAEMLAGLARQAGVLRARGAAGLVRRAHGDLHLGNMCLWRGEPVAFDALEFDEDLATIDVGYDLAFLLMDLDVRVDRAAANRVMNRYLARTGDWGLVALLPGSGKSTVARGLAPGLGAVVLRSDEIRKRRFGVAPEQRLPAAGYAAAVSQAVFAEISAAAGVIAGGGHAVVADATYMDPEHRASIAGSAERFLGVWLEVPMEELERRVAARRGDASDADLGVLRSAAQAGIGVGSWLAVDGGDTAAAVAAIRAALAICP